MNKRKIDDDECDDDLPYKKQMIQEYCNANIYQENDKIVAYKLIIFILREMKQNEHITLDCINAKISSNFPQITKNDLKIVYDTLNKMIVQKGSKQ